MERKPGKCWKFPVFEGKLQNLCVIWVKWKQSVCSITLLCSSTFYSLFLPFFVQEIFKFKYGKFFIKNSASISKFGLFFEPAGIFHFFTLSLEILDKTKLHLHKIVLDPLEIPRLKMKTLGNSTMSFSWSPLEIPHLWYPWEFHIFNPPFGFFLE